MKLFSILTSVAVAALLSLGGTAMANDIDADAATALAKKNDCFKCHAIDLSLIHI